MKFPRNCHCDQMGIDIRCQSHTYAEKMPLIHFLASCCMVSVFCEKVCCPGIKQFIQTLMLKVRLLKKELRDCRFIWCCKGLCLDSCLINIKDIGFISTFQERHAGLCFVELVFVWEMSELKQNWDGNMLTLDFFLWYNSFIGFMLLWMNSSSRRVSRGRGLQSNRSIVVVFLSS